jgi:uncharacterized membrane protein
MGKKQHEHMEAKMMSKADYFRELAYRLRGLPERERQNILMVYEDLFQKAMENGKHEEEVAESLGYPRIPHWEGSTRPPIEPKPVYQAMNHAPSFPAYTPPTKTQSGITAVLVTIALGFFNLVVVLGPFIGICGAILGMFVAGCALLISPLLALVTSDWGASSADRLLLLFAMIACFGVGILLTAVTTWFSKLFFKLTAMYIRFNVKLIKGA